MSTSSHADGQNANFLTEDKKCRICGFADIKNVNIFSSHNCKTLLPKILSVYPIILYQNDPLPKNICKKCIFNVQFMYNDIQRVMKTQSKWISNVRTVQPNHNYIRMLDLIEHTNTVTRESIKFTLGEDLNEHAIDRIMLSNITAGEKLCKKTNGAKNKLKQLSDIDSETESLERGNKKEIKNLQSILELNGCSLLAVGGKQSQIESSSTSNVNTNTQAKLIQDETNDEDDEMVLSQVSTSTATKTDCDSKQTLMPITFKCRYCPLHFIALETLAKHQQIHMRVEIPKIFQRKYLHKSVRRGRLITVQDRKCIRCLNCWRIFVDNKSILEHWSLGECDFYCHICGKEFAQAPKMLREHVPAAHGISYRSSKNQRNRAPIKTMTSLEHSADQSLKLKSAAKEPHLLDNCSEEYKPSTSQAKANCYIQSGAITSPQSKKHSNQIKNDDGTVSCHICHKSFQNFKARNSHMRKHKPSFAFGDVVLPPSKVGNDAYMQMETTAAITSCNNELPAIKFEDNECSNVEEKPAISLNFNSTTSSTLTKATTTVRGVRTKFVIRRSEINPTTSGLKVKPIYDLQNATSRTVPAAKEIATTTWVGPQTIKMEPVDITSDNAEMIPRIQPDNSSA